MDLKLGKKEKNDETIIRATKETGADDRHGALVIVALFCTLPCNLRIAVPRVFYPVLNVAVTPDVIDCNDGVRLKVVNLIFIAQTSVHALYASSQIARQGRGRQRLGLGEKAK